MKKIVQTIDWAELEKLKDSQGQSQFTFASGNIGDIVSSLISYLFPLAGILVLLYLLYGGFQMMLSRGDPKAMQSAKSKVTNALIGFVVIFTAYWIVQLIAVLLGLTTITNIF